MKKICVVVVVGVWALSVACEAKRLSLSENQNSMFLFSKSNNGNADRELSWNSPRFMRTLQSSCMIEVSSRGIRSIESSLTKKYGFCDPTSKYLNNKIEGLRRNHLVSEDCHAEYESLCMMKSHGGFFPSFKYDNASNLIFTGKHNPHIPSPILGHFQSLSKTTCGSNNDGLSKLGLGRVYSLNLTEDKYYVTACDILQSALLLLYEPIVNRIRIIPSTFGPFAYCVIIIIALIFLYGISLKYENLDAKEDLSAKTIKYKIYFFGFISICTGLVLILFSLIDGIAFIVVQDEIYFYVSAVLCILLALFGMYLQKMFYISDACLYGLCSICTTIYRSPENPYAAAISMGLGIDAWKKIYKLMGASFQSAPAPSSDAWFLFLDVTICAFMLCSTLELGLVPQFDEIEDWYVYSGIGCFASFASNLYLQLIQNKIIK